MHSEWD